MIIGVQDIKTNIYFKNINWESLVNKTAAVPYKPKVKSANDTSNF